MKLARSSLLALTLSLALVAPASAHQPVSLTVADSKISTSTILPDGTVSWAIYLDFRKANEVRNFRFGLREGEPLKVEYLILDRKPENKLAKSQLPTISIKTPSGKKIPLQINERTGFYEPFGGRNYLFLSRVNKPGEAGIYTATIRSKRSASIVVALGSREVRGEVMQVGTSSKQCPKPIPGEREIPIESARQLIGLSELSAEVCATTNNWGYRIAKRDGEDFALTMDYRADRINVNIEAGIIVELTVG